MSISKDLFLAILSMDAYNQGYGRGLEHGQTTIGNATVKTDSEAISLDSDGDGTSDAEDAGFYGVAYEITDGSGIDGLGTDETVISF